MPYRQKPLLKRRKGIGGPIQGSKMNTYGPAVFFIVLTIGAIGVLMIINLSGALLDRMKQPILARTRRNNGDLQRRRVVQHPNVICMLPMYETRRTEQKLW